MGSSSKSKKTKEQLDEEKRIGEEAARKHAERRKVLVHSGSGIGSGKDGFGPAYRGSGPEGTPTEYAVYNDKRGEYIKIGDVDSGGRAYWDADQGVWRSSAIGASGSAQYWSTDVAAPARQQAAKPSSGGGGRAPPGKIVYPQGKVIDTGPVGGYAQNNQPMYNYYPVTQGQQLNPLVDPNNWLQNPDPRYGLLNSAGLYVNNPQPIGVLT